MMKYKIVFFILFIPFIYLGNIYKNCLISIKIEEKIHLNEFISSKEVSCQGYISVDCTLQNINLMMEDTKITMKKIILENTFEIYQYIEGMNVNNRFIFKFDGMDINQTGAMKFIIPKKYIPFEGIVEFDMINNVTKINLDVNISKSNIHLELDSKNNIFRDNLNINFNKVMITNRDNFFTMIYDIYKINFLDIKINSNKEFSRGFNLSLGVDSYDLIDFKTFQGEPFAIFLDTILSEISNTLDLENNALVEKINNFIINNKSILVIKKGEISL